MKKEKTISLLKSENKDLMKKLIKCEHKLAPALKVLSKT